MCPLAVIKFIDPRTGQVDPGFGIEAGGGRPDNDLPGYGHPDQGLPGYGHPDQGLPGYGHPGQGLPGGPVRPDNGLPPINVGRPWPPRPHPWPPQKPEGPGITDPDFGIDAGLAPTQPIYIPDGSPATPDNSLPPYGGNLPASPTPPGTIWPPLPGFEPDAEGWLLVLVLGMGFRYVKVVGEPPVVNPAPPTGPPPTGPPPTGGTPLPPTKPPVAGQPLPPTATPK